MANRFVVGDWVEVKSAGEILATLDDRGTLDGMPFMPEMLACIGKRFRISKRATKTCDTIDKAGFRRVKETVLLDGARCSGMDHGGCQAGCMIFWKERWIKPAPAPSLSPGMTIETHGRGNGNGSLPRDPDHARLEARVRKAARVDDTLGTDGEPVYMCLITEMKRASLSMAWWDLRHFVADVRSGNRRIAEVVRALLLGLFSWAQDKRGGSCYPSMEGGPLKKTPNDDLRLQPGDLVKVRPPQEIVNTLDANCRTRGLRFDVGMFRYCEGEYRVAIRAQRLIDQRTGKMLHMTDQSPCILLDGATCHGDFMKLCPRSEYVFWREAWLQRVP